RRRGKSPAPLPAASRTFIVKERLYVSLGWDSSEKTTHPKSGQAMTNNRRLAVGFVASALVVGLLLPASAAELFPLTPQKSARVMVPRKAPRPHIVRIANAGPVLLPIGASGSHLPYPLIVGIAY